MNTVGFYYRTRLLLITCSISQLKKISKSPSRSPNGDRNRASLRAKQCRTCVDRLSTTISNMKMRRRLSDRNGESWGIDVEPQTGCGPTSLVQYLLEKAGREERERERETGRLENPIMQRQRGSCGLCAYSACVRQINGKTPERGGESRS